MMDFNECKRRISIIFSKEILSEMVRYSSKVIWEAVQVLINAARRGNIMAVYRSKVLLRQSRNVPMVIAYLHRSKSSFPLISFHDQ